MFRDRIIRRSWPLIVIVLLRPGSEVPVRGQVLYNRDVRPILSEYCWRCHGFDAHERQGGLRLDVREAALRPADSGVPAIVPGKPGQSPLLARVSSADESQRMPPSETHQRLTQKQIDTLRRWIAEGVEYQNHWSLQPIVRPPLPSPSSHQNPIDAFVAARLKKESLTFAPEAAPDTLLRRLFFDLTGLPPGLDDIRRFHEDGYEQTIDRLLASPHYGERMAADWLDYARYADTNGYFGDRPRQIWLWRDWVIDAFNSNMPYDQFTIEQLAGDMLPNATVSQRVATGFNRNHMSNNETGIIDEEYRVEYVVDRVDTTMTTWLGLTVGCARCHDHKYDPITQQEYYELFAFFNSVPERGLLVGNNPPPLMTVATAAQEQKLAAAKAARAAAEKEFADLTTEIRRKIATWEQNALRTLPASPTSHLLFHQPFEQIPTDRTAPSSADSEVPRGVLGQAAHFDATQQVQSPLADFAADDPWTIGVWIKPDGPLSCVLSKIQSDGERRGLELLWTNGGLAAHLVDRWKVSAIEVATTETIPAKTWHHVVLRYDGSRRANGLDIFIDGKPAAVKILADTLDGSISTAAPFRIGRRDSGLGFYGDLDELRVLEKAIPADEIAAWGWSERIRGIVQTSREARSREQRETLFDYFVDHYAAAETRAARDRLAELRRAEQQAREAIPTTLVMADQDQPRKTFVLERGQYDRRGQEVQPDVPASLSAWPLGAPRNRLGLARWLVADANPLTARVAVNRIWKQCFGYGLVRSMDDFGTQGQPPTHPALLDYLASEFRESGWDIKALLRLILTSRTYRQNSRFHIRDGEVFDPANRLLARGPSFRLPMEMIRDQALAASGLLVRTIGGPSVKPYQPPGLWEEVSYNGQETYVPDPGAGLWRRSVYTYIKRQAPPPALLLLDGPTREKCQMLRPSTNTPLQSLLLLNGDTWLESSRVLAEHIQAMATTDRQRLRQLWQTVLTRAPTATELQMVNDLLDRQRERFARSPKDAAELLTIGEAVRSGAAPLCEVAAWTIVAHTLLNLDEAIMRR